MRSSLPNTDSGRAIGHQVLQSGTSVATSFHEALRARSNAEFIAKPEIVEHELNETALWLERLIESETVSRENIDSLLHEADELIRIAVASIKTAESNSPASAFRI